MTDSAQDEQGLLPYPFCGGEPFQRSDVPMTLVQLEARIERLRGKINDLSPARYMDRVMSDYARGMEHALSIITGEGGE